MRWSCAFFSSPRQYAPATRVNLKWPRRAVEGTWGPRQRSVKAGEFEYVETDDALDNSPRSSSVGAVSTAWMISSLKGWSWKRARPSAIEYSRRVNGWSSAMMARISASMRSRSSSLKCSPPGSSKS